MTTQEIQEITTFAVNLLNRINDRNQNIQHYLANNTPTHYTPITNKGRDWYGKILVDTRNPHCIGLVDSIDGLHVTLIGQWGTFTRHQSIVRARFMEAQFN